VAANGGRGGWKHRCVMHPAPPHLSFFSLVRVCCNILRSLEAHIYT
jgi:hypothetical protein